MKQAPPLVAVRLRELVRDIRRHARTPPTAAERIANDVGCGHFLRGFLHDEARFRSVSSGSFRSVADVGR